jgi:CBS domain-containing protein
MEEAIVSTHPLIRVHELTTIQEAARVMSDVSIGAVGVQDDRGRFVGLITERDLLWALAQGLDHSSQVKEVMNSEPVVVDGPVSVGQALEIMESGHFRHVIVREGEDDLRILSLRDLPELGEPKSRVTDHHPASASEMRRMFGSSYQR